jgi:hypothetical protein
MDTHDILFKFGKNVAESLISGNYSYSLVFYPKPQKIATMNISALILALITQSLILGFTVYCFYLVLKKPKTKD